MKIVGIMPIKLNNERLPGKNTMLLGGKPLIQYALEEVQASHAVDEMYVYCSSTEIEPYLLSGVHFLQRPAILDEPTSNFTQIFDCFSKAVQADIYVYAHATAPFVSRNSIRKCVEAVCSGEYDSAFTATVIQDFLWQDGKPLNFDAANLPRSQDLKPIYRESSGVYVFTNKVFETLHRRVGVKPYVCPIDFREAVDINTPSDFHMAQALLNVNPMNWE